MTRGEAPALVDLVLEEMSRALERGEDVKLSSFATFSVSSKNARLGRNPKTGVEVMITPRKVVTFSPSNVLKGEIVRAHRKRGA